MYIHILPLCQVVKIGLGPISNIVIQVPYLKMFNLYVTVWVLSQNEMEHVCLNLQVEYISAECWGTFFIPI